MMIDYSLILTQIEQSLKSLPEYNNLQDFTTEFYQFWQTLGQLVQQSLVQSQIEQREAKYKYAKKKKKKRYYTPLGEIVLIRRGYSTPNGVKFKVDEELGLPSNKWLPHSIEILDFYHLSEYVWKVAKKAYAQCEIKQKEWVNKQQKLLKESSWQTVINNCGKIKRKNQELSLAITNLEGYLNNNKTRIDYKRYLELGLMIGSGVVESSNRRIITQRLKQAGMHWSKRGAEGVMALRAMYLSNSNRWLNFWKLRRINKVS